MGKEIFRKLIGTAIALVALMVLAPSAQADEFQECLKSDQMVACNNCMTKALTASDPKAAYNDCICFWLTPEISKGECKGAGGKLAYASVYKGQAFTETYQAITAAKEDIKEMGQTGDMTAVLKFFASSGNYLVHLVGIPDWYDGDPDFYAPLPPSCEESGDCHVYIGGILCTKGTNQDWSPSAGCQSGAGCRELPPSEWVGVNCPIGTIGCCTSLLGCSAVIGDTAKDGVYGTTSPGCPTGPL